MLNGFNETQIKEVARVVAVGTGYSAYFHGVEYPIDKFKEELGAAVEHIKANS